MKKIHTETVIDRLIAGEALPKLNKYQQMKNERLLTIVSAYDERKDNIIDYIKGCTHNFDY